jgi:glycine/D-amino acid oxidase-like deaminating enzyme
MQVLSTDVAIVGGGAAGCYAALELQRRAITPLIICKGLVGKSGASLFAGNLVISRGLGNTEEQARNTPEFLIKYYNQFLIDSAGGAVAGSGSRMSIIRSSSKPDFTSAAMMRDRWSRVREKSAASPPMFRAISGCR